MKRYRYGLYLGTAVIIAGVLFLSVNASGIFQMTNEPSFCAQCHVMSEEYSAWVKGGVHNSIKCIDCHLPQDTQIKFLFWKAVDGGKDFVSFYAGIVSEMIELSGRGKNTVQANCIRCHEGRISKMLSPHSRNCWDCHKRIAHKLTGIRETL